MLDFDDDWEEEEEERIEPSFLPTTFMGWN
jgi:hypothetical protein